MQSGSDGGGSDASHENKATKDVQSPTARSKLVQPNPDFFTNPQYVVHPAEYILSFPVVSSTQQERLQEVQVQLTQLMAKQSHVSPRPVWLTISLSSINVCASGGELIMSHSLRRISYATCCPQSSQFAFLAREPQRHSSSQCCHVFLTHSPLEAEKLKNIVADAFKLAYAQQQQQPSSASSSTISAFGDFIRHKYSIPTIPAHFSHDLADDLPEVKVVNQKPQVTHLAAMSQPADLELVETASSSSQSALIQPIVVEPVESSSVSSGVATTGDQVSSSSSACGSPNKAPVTKVDDGGSIPQPPPRQRQTAIISSDPAPSSLPSPSHPAVMEGNENVVEEISTDLSLILLPPPPEFRNSNPELQVTVSSPSCPPCSPEPRPRRRRPATTPQATQPPPPPPARHSSVLSSSSTGHSRPWTWYQPQLSREVALQQLIRGPVGSFLIRDSTSHPGWFALSVLAPSAGEVTTACVRRGRVCHFLVQRTLTGVKLKGLEKEWPSLASMVVHLSVLPEILPCPLHVPREEDEEIGTYEHNPVFQEHERVRSLPQHQMKDDFRTTASPFLPQNPSQPDVPTEGEDYLRLSEFSVISSRFNRASMG